MNTKLLIASLLSLLSMVTMCDGCKSYPEFDRPERGEFKSMDGIEISNNFCISYSFNLEENQTQQTFRFFDQPAQSFVFDEITDDSAVLTINGGFVDISTIMADAKNNINLPESVVSKLKESITLPLQLTYNYYKDGKKKTEEVFWFGQQTIEDYTLIVTGSLITPHYYNIDLELYAPGLY